jgi:hypothetical protein
VAWVSATVLGQKRLHGHRARWGSRPQSMEVDVDAGPLSRNRNMAIAALVSLLVVGASVTYSGALSAQSKPGGAELATQQPAAVKSAWVAISAAQAKLEKLRATAPNARVTTIVAPPGPVPTKLPALTKSGVPSLTPLTGSGPSLESLGSPTMTAQGGAECSEYSTAASGATLQVGYTRYHSGFQMTTPPNCFETWASYSWKIPGRYTRLTAEVGYNYNNSCLGSTLAFLGNDGAPLQFTSEGGEPVSSLLLPDSGVASVSVDVAGNSYFTVNISFTCGNVYSIVDVLDDALSSQLPKPPPRSSPSEVVNGFSATSAKDAYSVAERQMLMKLPKVSMVVVSGTPVCTLQASAATKVRNGLLISWTIAPSATFLHMSSAGRRAAAQVIEKYLMGLLARSKSLYLGVLRADRVPLQSNVDLANWWAVRVQSVSTTGSLMTFQVANTATTSTISWNNVFGVSSSASEALAPAALASLLYYTKNIAPFPSITRTRARVQSRLRDRSFHQEALRFPVTCSLCSTRLTPSARVGTSGSD